MTVSSTTSKVSYTGNGLTTAFAVPFYVLAAADLQVILRSGTTETVQALTTNYTVSGAGNEAGGTVTMLVAPASGTTLTIRRSIAATQGTDLLPNDRLPAEDLEDGLDKLTMIAQQLGEESDRSIKFPASDAAVSAQLPAASARASKFLTFDANGLPVATVGVDATLDIFTQAGTGATPRSVNSKLRDTISAADFGAIGDGSNETAKVQLALNSIPAAGGTVFVPAGVKFNLTQLTFPQRCNLEYYVDSDMSTPGTASDLGSGELVLFSSNSSYPTDVTGGIVNEWRFTAPFHPGVVVDVRKDVTGANQWLAPNQDLTDPARASYNILDEQTPRWTNLYVSYPRDDKFSGVLANTYRTQIVISGVGTSNWSSAPSVNDVVYQSNGARGMILSQTANSTTVLWNSGRFAAGLPLRYGTSPVNISTSNVSGAAWTSTPMPWLAQDFRYGSFSIGLPPQAPEGDLFAVGGRIVSTNTRSAGQYVEKTVTEPGYGFIASYEDTPRLGRFMVSESANGHKRVVLRDVTATNNIANVGACIAHSLINVGGTGSSSRFNVNTITKSATGVYEVAFTNAAARNDYAVMVTCAAPDDYAYVTDKTTSGFIVRVVTLGTSTPRDLTAAANLACFGGDI
jgi:hypothetical protein